MRLLDRYIGRTVLTHILVVLGVLLSIYFFSTLVGDSGYIGQGRYSFVMALAYSHQRDGQRKNRGASAG